MNYEKKYNEALELAREKRDIVLRNGADITVKFLEEIFPELRESEDERIKNKSGYYKAGKFWKASTLWNAVKGKSPQRVPNMYILQECTWNISSLQRFADEVKNVQEVDLNYPIILDMNGNILDGAHRVVKAYLEGKDIDIVYLGDDEWPEPDYDEEKAVKESEDERIRKAIVKSIEEDSSVYEQEVSKEQMLAYLEKQKEQKSAQTDDEKEYIRTLKSLISDFIRDKQPEDVVFYQKMYDWLEGRHVEQKPAEWSEEDEKYLNRVINLWVNDFGEDSDTVKWLKSLRPSWKPSEEQMKAFKGYIEDFQAKAEAAVGGWNNFDVMIRLYEQLKKLM